MELAERVKAAALCAKGRVMLIKEMPNAIDRIKKWDLLKTEAIAKGAFDAEKLADECYRRAKDYRDEITRIQSLIKRVSLLDDPTEKIERFCKLIGLISKEANKSFKSYRTGKQRFEDRVGKEKWDDKLVRWLKQDQSAWNKAWRLFSQVSKASVTIE